MAVEAKEVLEFLGYKHEEIKDLTELKTKFDSEFVRASTITEESEPVKKILGKVFGTLENDVKKVAKKFELDIDFDSEDFKANKKITDKLNFVIGKYDEKNKTIIQDLTAKAGQGNDEKVKEIQSKYEKVSQKAKDFETLLNSTKTEFDSFKSKTAEEIKNKTLSVHKKEVYSKAKFLPEANEFTKKGFLNSFEESYILDLDENESPIILDKAGKRIASTKTAGTFKTPQEVLEEELIKAKLYPLNKDGGKPKPVFNQQAQTQTQTPNRQQRTVATRLG